MKTIAVISCYNEAERVARVVEQTKQYVDEVIVVDDGSKDATSEQAKEAIVIKHIINLGKGAAMKTGCIAARDRNADIIILIDGDGQHNPHDIPKFIHTLIEESFDLVVGKRAYNKNMPILYKLGNWGLNTLFTLLFGLKIDDTQCGYRAFRTAVYPSIEWTSNGYAVETEMLAHAGRHQLRVKEIPIETVYHDSVKGTTVVDGVKIGLNMLKWRMGW